MHCLAADIPTFLLVRLPIILIKIILVVSPTIRAASTVISLLDIKTTGVASVPIRERLRPVEKCRGAVAV